MTQARGHISTHVLQISHFFLAAGSSVATSHLTLDLHTKYPLLWAVCGMQSLPNTSTHDQHRNSNPRPFDIESDALSSSLWYARIIITS